MSDCIKQGLYHPNCQDSHTTYFGDIDDEEDEENTEEQEKTEEEPKEETPETENEEDEVGQTEVNNKTEYPSEEKRVDSTVPASKQQITPQEQRINEQLYNAEQRQNYCERQVQRFERMGKYSLDKDNQRIYRARRNEWKEKLAQIKESIQNFKKSVAKSAGSGIIKLKTDLGRSSYSETYSSRGIDLPDNLKSYLEILKSTDDYILGEAGSFTMKDLSAMSKETGVEFACVTVNGNSYLIRGNEKGTNIPNEILEEMVKNNGTLDFHSHPHDGDTIPSVSDRNVMGMLEDTTGQKTSKIVTTDNQVAEFDKFGVRSIQSVKNEIDEEYANELMKLFGG